MIAIWFWFYPTRGQYLKHSLMGCCQRSFTRLPFFGRHNPSAAILSSWNKLWRSTANFTAANIWSSQTASGPCRMPVWQTSKWGFLQIYKSHAQKDWYDKFTWYLIFCTCTGLADQTFELVVAGRQLSGMVLHGLALDIDRFGDLELVMSPVKSSRNFESWKLGTQSLLVLHMVELQGDGPAHR